MPRGEVGTRRVNSVKPLSGLEKVRPRKTLNRALLRRVAARLRRLRHEGHYNQAEVAKKTTCGTAACIAGWTVVEAGFRLPKDITGDEDRDLVADILQGAEVLLGLSSSQAGNLFSGDPYYWPQKYQDRWNTGEERHSRIAADLLDAIADGKVRL